MIQIVKNKISEDVDYKDENIRELVREEFLKKCYLCEGLPVQNYEIDHFFPQKFFPHLVKRYENLFFICSKCNKIRPKDINTKTKEILDSTIDDVENYISLCIDIKECKKAIIKPNYTNDKIINKKIDNTINLLEKIYNGIDTTSSAYRCLQDDIVEDILTYESEINTYFDDYINTPFERRFKEKIDKQINKKERYSSFKKSIYKKYFS